MVSTILKSAQIAKVLNNISRHKIRKNFQSLFFLFFTIQNVPTEEYLNDEEIISPVQFVETGENGNDSSSDEEIPLIPVKNAISGLEKHLLIFLSNRKTTKNLKLMVCAFLENI